jgi:3-oxoacyl-[acyl-carrier protein] reductase
VKKQPTALVFGSNGSIGSACFRAMSETCPTFALSHQDSNFSIGGSYSSVIWAQGLNLTRSFLETSDSDWDELMDANLHFVRKTVKALVTNNLMQRPASFVFIGSVWAEIAKANKSAYMVSKSALQGLTRSLAIELAPLEIRVNSISPGVVDNSMTRANLSSDQLTKVNMETPGKCLVTPEDVANVAKFLTSEGSVGINGQCITVDHGWAIAKYI